MPASRGVGLGRGDDKHDRHRVIRFLEADEMRTGRSLRAGKVGCSA